MKVECTSCSIPYLPWIRAHVFHAYPAHVATALSTALTSFGVVCLCNVAKVHPRLGMLVHNRLRQAISKFSNVTPVSGYDSLLSFEEFLRFFYLNFVFSLNLSSPLYFLSIGSYASICLDRTNRILKMTSSSSLESSSLG